MQSIGSVRRKHLEARHVAKLPSWHMYRQAGDSGQLGFAPSVSRPDPTISVPFNQTKRDRFEYLKRSLFVAYVMASGDTCPQGISNARHVATLAGLKTRREDCTATGQEYNTASEILVCLSLSSARCHGTMLVFSQGETPPDGRQPEAVTGAATLVTAIALHDGNLSERTRC